MQKVVIFTKKRKDITMEQFKKHIREKHSVIEKKLWALTSWVKKGTRSFVIPVPTAVGETGQEPIFDCMFELYLNPECKGKPFDDLSSGEGRKVFEELMEDEKHFIDQSPGEVPPSKVFYIVEQEVIDEK